MTRWLQRHHCTPTPWLGVWLLEFVRFRHMYLYECTEESQENRVTTQHVQVISHWVICRQPIENMCAWMCVCSSLYFSLSSHPLALPPSPALSLSHEPGVKGISSCGTIIPVTPFWPWRDENLSPSSGRRCCEYANESCQTHTHTSHVTHELWVVSHTHIRMSHVRRICRRDFVAQIRSQMLQIDEWVVSCMCTNKVWGGYD